MTYYNPDLYAYYMLHGTYPNYVVTPSPNTIILVPMPKSSTEYRITWQYYPSNTTTTTY